MNLKYRKLITKIKPLHKLVKWCMYNSGIFYYKNVYWQQNYEKFFKKLKASKVGKRCFIIGNGPSLNTDDLDKLAKEDCFGVNEVHRFFHKTKWRPKYYIIMDRYSKTTPEEIKNIPSEIFFLGSYYCRFNSILRDDFICLHQHFNLNDNTYEFSENIDKYVVNAPTVSYAAMQVAAYMGYSEIYLLGFDHNYSFEFAKDGSVIYTGQKATHFYKDDVAEDIIGNVWGMTKAYEAFRDYAQTHNIIVKNATRGGRLDVFERVDFDDLVLDK